MIEILVIKFNCLISEIRGDEILKLWNKLVIVNHRHKWSFFVIAKSIMLSAERKRIKVRS
jgi:hypothetical protein